MWKQIENVLINYMLAHKSAKYYNAKNVHRGKLKRTKMYKTF